MKKTILILISISLALICISGASAASLADDCDGTINQQDIPDNVVDDVTDESADASDINTDESEESNEIIKDDSTDDNDIIEDTTADDSALDIAETEDAIDEKPLVTNFIDDTINQMADSILNQIIGNVTIPDLNVQATKINIDIFGPTFNAAIYYYAYWNAYKTYYGPFKIYDAISAIYALVHQSYGSLATLNIVDAIFEMDPSIKKADDNSERGPNYPKIIC